MTKEVLIPCAVTIVLILLGLIRKRSKFLYKMQMLWMWILIAFNTDAIDFDVHENIFKDSTPFSIDKLFSGGAIYDSLCYWFKAHSYKFTDLNMVVSCVIVLILYKLIKNYSKRPCFTMSLLFIYPFIDNIIQKRWFFASVIVLYAMQYLQENTRKGKLIYIGLVLLAMQIHVASIAYLLYLIVAMIPENKVKRSMPFVLLIGLISIPIIPKVALLVFPAYKVQLYFYDLRLGLKDTLLWVGFHTGFVVLFGIFYRLNTKKEEKFDRAVVMINLESLVFIPLYYYEPTFIRYYRAMLLYNYMYIANQQPNGTVYKQRTLLATLMLLCYVCASFVLVYMITGKGLEEMVLRIFENNTVLNWIFS